MTCWLSGERSLLFGLLVCKTFLHGIYYGENCFTETSIKREVSPKFVKGSKLYGRKSLPYSSDDFDCLADDEDDTEVRSSTKSLKHSLTVGSITDTEEVGDKMSHVMRKPVFRVNDQIRHKPGCADVENG